MSIENRIDTLTVALVELTETVRELQQQMAHGQQMQQQTTTPPAEEEKPKAAKPAKKAAKKEPEPEPQAEPEQPSGITHDQLQSECIKKVRESGGDWFKFKLQDVLRERGVKTISQLPADALGPVHKVLFEEDK